MLECCFLFGQIRKCNWTSEKCTIFLTSQRNRVFSRVTLLHSEEFLFPCWVDSFCQYLKGIYQSVSRKLYTFLPCNYLFFISIIVHGYNSSKLSYFVLILGETQQWYIFIRHYIYRPHCKSEEPFFIALWILPA